MAGDKELAGKLAIVTGAAKQNGIGYACALKLARSGADIVLHYNTNKDAAAKSAADIRQLGVKVVVIQSDASKVTFGKEIVEATLKAFPKRTIDIIVNNAGHALFHESVESSPLDEFDALFHANVRGPLSLLQAALPHLARPGGRIINISSVVARNGTKFANIYSATKGALNSMTLGWAEELGEKGITANVVAPGPIDTDYAAPEEHPLIQKFRAEQYIKRNGTAEEVAAVVLFVSGPSSSFVTDTAVTLNAVANIIAKTELLSDIYANRETIADPAQERPGKVGKYNAVPESAIENGLSQSITAVKAMMPGRIDQQATDTTKWWIWARGNNCPR